MSLRDKDIANIRRAFNRTESIKNFTCQDYHNILDSLERFHLEYFLLACKASNCDQGQAKRWFIVRHEKMNRQLKSLLIVSDLPKDPDE